MARAYYSASVKQFLTAGSREVLGEIVQNNQHALEDLQRNAWLAQIEILKEGAAQLAGYARAHIALEYSIPRMGKRVDAVIFINGIVFVLEFKVGSVAYTRHAVDQVLNYALDLKDFHNASHQLDIVPILIATGAKNEPNNINQYEDNIYYPLRCNAKNYMDYIKEVMQCGRENAHISPEEWIHSSYKPTPTIIEAAQALYAGHQVEEISRSDATALNLKDTAQAISTIIEQAKAQQKKAICFVTGVPGAGKTLAGLNIANKRHSLENEEHAVFLSGNLPLVQVLREALVRDEMQRAKSKGETRKRGRVEANVKLFIQNIHHFRDEYLDNQKPPTEAIAIFDEAQRAWTLEQTQSFMRRKRNRADFSQSEPEFLIGVLDRHISWAVIVCLVGSGQEINTGEAGISEWFSAISKSYNDWDIYVSEQMDEAQYAICERSQIVKRSGLHLSTSMRSYRSEAVSEFVHRLLEETPLQQKRRWMG